MKTADGSRISGRTVLITGASQGIGLEFARQYFAMGWKVAATVLHEGDEKDLLAIAQADPSRLKIFRLDVSSPDSISACAARVQKSFSQLDALINNAGCVAPEGNGLFALNQATMLSVYAVNALGPLFVTREFLPLLQKSERARVGFLVSRWGVLREELPSANSQYSYGLTKSALLHGIQHLAGDVKKLGVMICGLDPGWVLTPMTAVPVGERYQLPAEKSVKGMIDALENLTAEKSGKFIRWNGKLCEWYAPPITPEELQIRS